MQLKLTKKESRWLLNVLNIMVEKEDSPYIFRIQRRLGMFPVKTKEECWICQKPVIVERKWKSSLFKVNPLTCSQLCKARLDWWFRNGYRYCLANCGRKIKVNPYRKGKESFSKWVCSTRCERLIKRTYQSDFRAQRIVDKQFQSFLALMVKKR